MAKYRDLIKILKKNGWTFKRQAKGSHEIWQRNDETVTVPKHSSEMPTGTFNTIKKKAEVSNEN